MIVVTYHFIKVGAEKKLITNLNIILEDFFIIFDKQKKTVITKTVTF